MGFDSSMEKKEKVDIKILEKSCSTHYEAKQFVSVCSWIPETSL